MVPRPRWGRLAGLPCWDLLPFVSRGSVSNRLGVLWCVGHGDGTDVAAGGKRKKASERERDTVQI